MKCDAGNEKQKSEFSKKLEHRFTRFHEDEQQIGDRLVPVSHRGDQRDDSSLDRLVFRCETENLIILSNDNVSFK